MIARKKILIIITSIICVFGLLTTIIFLRKYNSPQFVITEINQTLKLSIPYNDITFFEKNGGGFHGDGDIIVILTLNNEENKKFQNNLDDRWMKLEQKSEIYNYLWSSETTPGEKAFGGMLNRDYLLQLTWYSFSVTIPIIKQMKKSISMIFLIFIMLGILMKKVRFIFKRQIYEFDFNYLI